MKELIIIVYKIDVRGMTRQHAEEQFHELMSEYNLKNDEELKENYLIREIWIPVQDESDVKIIYPVPKYTQSIELEGLIENISESMKNYPNSDMANNFNKIVRTLKLKKLNS